VIHRGAGHPTEFDEKGGVGSKKKTKEDLAPVGRTGHIQGAAQETLEKTEKNRKTRNRKGETTRNKF